MRLLPQKKFIKISPTNIFGLKKQKPEALICKIEDALSNWWEEYLTHPYSGLSKSARNWKKLTGKEKEWQVEYLMQVSGQIETKREEIRMKEREIGSLEASLK